MPTSPLRDLQFRLEYALLRLIVGIVRIVPLDVATHLSAWSWRRLAPLINPKRHKRALDNLRIAVATGNIPENINFAIKTGALRDFLDNSVVPYQTGEPKGELKTTDIAANARAYTMLISCIGTEQADAKR